MCRPAGARHRPVDPPDGPPGGSFADAVVDIGAAPPHHGCQERGRG
ncbi:hypothetical protein ACFPM0_01780 [Pseudonocardia sulfidoxydans]